MFLKHTVVFCFFFSLYDIGFVFDFDRFRSLFFTLVLESICFFKSLKYFVCFYLVSYGTQNKHMNVTRTK